MSTTKNRRLKIDIKAEKDRRRVIGMQRWRKKHTDDPRTGNAEKAHPPRSHRGDDHYPH